MNTKKYKTNAEIKKFVQENPNLFEESYKDLQKFLKIFMAFVVIGVAVSSYYLVKSLMA